MQDSTVGTVEFRVQMHIGRALLRGLIPPVVLGILLAIFMPSVFAVFKTAAERGMLFQHFVHEPMTYLVLATLVGFIAWARLREIYERIVVGPEGLSYTTWLGGPLAFLARLHPSWAFSRASIEKVELQVLSQGGRSRSYWFQVFAGTQQRRIDMPQAWVQSSGGQGIPTTKSGRDEASVRAAIMTSPLVQALRVRDIVVVDRPGLMNVGRQGYDIAKDKRLLLVVGLLLFFLVYFLLDTFIVWQYMALQNVPVWPYVLVGPLGLWLGITLGRQAPRMESYLISVMLAGALCGAAYPLMLRLNALTAPAGDSFYEYTQLSAGLFKPVDPHLPYIYFDQQAQYWGHFPNGSKHEFRVFKGVLGFYEVDTARVQDEAAAWRATQKSR